MTVHDPFERPGVAATALLTMVKLYQACLSPYLGRQCRFVPTCSNYFAEAVRTHGAVRGALMGAWRVLRCNPLCEGGYDPVPDRAKH
jgi:putative membrane protein insertion efficiency factor